LYENIKIEIPPGVNSDITPYAGGAHWADCNLVRFRHGFPETFGGWNKYTSNVLDGVCRSAHHWHTISATQYTGFGTNLKYYVENGGVLTNITPLRSSGVSLISNPFSFTSGSSVVTVTHVNHGAADGDFVTLSGAAGEAGIAAEEINTEHQIARIDADTYTIDVGSNASSTTAGGGGSVLASYQISIGSAFSFFGDGWGAGFYSGGEVRLSAVIGTDPFDTTNTSSTVTVNHTSHGAVDGDYVTFTSVASDVNGISAVYFEDVVFEITYVDANSYTIELPVAATSTGSGGGSVAAKYYETSNSTGWGQASSSTVQGALPRIWGADNFGEDLIIVPRDGPLYYWDIGTASAVLISGISGADEVPEVATEISVSDARHVIAFGTNPLDSSDQDKGLIRFSSSEDYLDWNIASTTNSAGELQIPLGSEFVTHLKTRQEILVWTESSLCSMQYVGAPDIYGIFVISPRITILGPGAKVGVNDLVFWMGTDNFYMYDGRVSVLPCTVWNRVFDNINASANYNVVTGLNRKFNEIIWFYPSEGNTANDRYVAYNYEERLWYYGELDRTCWIDIGLTDNPRATDANGVIYSHEIGKSDGSTSPASAMNCFITSSEIELNSGKTFMSVSRIIPDITFDGSPAATPTANITISPYKWPGGAAGTNKDMDIDRSSSVSAVVEEYTEYKDIRLRARSITMKISSNEADVGWRSGTQRLRVRTSGRR
jgi:hypothetical protein